MDQEDQACPHEQTVCRLRTAGLLSPPVQRQDVGKLEQRQRCKEQVQAPPSANEVIACKEADNPEQDKQSQRGKEPRGQTAFIT